MTLGPKSFRLIEDGPLVEVEVRHHPAALGDLQQHVKLWGEVPSVPPMLFLVDTGARHTLVDQQVLDVLKIEPFRFTAIVTANVVLEDCPTYLVELRIKLGNDIAVLPTSIVGLPTGSILSGGGAPKFRGLLGRSSLQRARFTYNGAAGTFDIEVVK